MPPRRERTAADVPKTPLKDVLRWLGGRTRTSPRAAEYVPCGDCGLPLLPYLAPHPDAAPDAPRVLAVPVNEVGQPVHPTQRCSPDSGTPWTWDADRVDAWLTAWWAAIDATDPPDQQEEP